VPLVMTIHGAHNTSALARSWSKMNAVSDQNGFIVVYPQGVDCWNAGFTIGGCPAAPDDVGFLKAVVADVESHACIDPKQVYATGISNGSMMSQYLACQASDVFAAVAGVSGGAQCSTIPRPVSLFYVHGTEDKTISYSSAQPDVDGWVKRDGCGTTPMETYNMGSTKCVTGGRPRLRRHGLQSKSDDVGVLQAASQAVARRFSHRAPARRVQRLMVTPALDDSLGKQARAAMPLAMGSAILACVRSWRPERGPYLRTARSER
jgi:hypothetical protein